MDRVGGDVSAFLRPGLSLFLPTCDDDDGEDVRMGMAWSGVAKGVASSRRNGDLNPGLPRDRRGYWTAILFRLN